jgi:hypothetical protein
MLRIETAVLVALAGGAGGCADPGTAPTPAGGGENYHLDYAQFQTRVAPVLVDAGCHAVECHGGGIRGTFELSPLTALDAAFDFEQARLQVDPWSPEMSSLLTKPLAADAGGATHSWEPFTSSDDAGYQTILDWILAGEFR